MKWFTKKMPKTKKGQKLYYIKKIDFLNREIKRLETQDSQVFEIIIDMKLRCYKKLRTMYIKKLNKIADVIFIIF